MKTYGRHPQLTRYQSQRGVAVVTALFVLMILSVIAVAVLSDVQGELRMSGIERNSERALKLAEMGIQVARATIQQGAVSGSLASVDGFAEGGYFFAALGSGMPGNEKWAQWHYDAKISGNNVQSEVTTPLRPVWMKESPGRNGSWSGSSFYLNNIYGIVAGGAYFPIEFDTDTEIRAVDEYTGREGVRFDPEGDFTWEGDSEGDKSLAENSISQIGYNNSYVVRMSPMGSFTNLSTIPNKDPQIVQQTIYVTYAGDVNGGSASTSTDTTSTVRLRAINSLCDHLSDPTKVKSLWEFDTGIHGIATAPSVFDPTPRHPGDEIIYFAVTNVGSVNLRNKSSMENYKMRFNEADQGITIFAVVDNTSSNPINAGLGECDKTGSYFLKWAHPFPDPNVEQWTDYPVEEGTATNGMFPPYIRVPSDMTPFMPEEDIMYDYRDSFYSDRMQNQVRGNHYMAFDPYSVSPVVQNVLYRLDRTNVNGALMMTTQRAETIAGVPIDPNDPNSALAFGDPADPYIELYLAYAAFTKVKYTDPMPHSNHSNISWSRNYELEKYSALQARVIALRDRLDGTCDAAGRNCVWDWDSAKSRFPTFKWTYRLPSWDPRRSDPRPWNGYGRFTWDTWFEQQVAPMTGATSRDQDGTRWDQIPDYTGGRRDLYGMVYAAYESLGYPDGSGYNNNLNPPTTSNGAPVSFDTSEKWDINTLQMMGIRDTWDDYMEGHQTNPMWDAMVNDPVTDPTPRNAFAMPVKSNPVESLWTHKHDGVICATDGGMIPHTYPTSAELVVTYSDDERTEWAGNADKVGFDRPYVWNERLWQANVKGSATRGLDQQGWKDSGLSTNRNSNDIDVEGETSSFCRDCLEGDGLMVTVFNHDIGGPDIEDLRMHAVNARSGKHVWDFHMPATLAGDYFNGTPSIANNLVFVAYTSRNGNRQGAVMRVIDADTGDQKQEILFDNDPNSKSWYDGKTAGRADVLLLPPTIANGAVYVGTYHFRGTLGSGSQHNDDCIRIFAFSPVLRMFSTGIYPMAYPGPTTLPDFSVPEGKGSWTMPRAERRLQVWITGAGSKWEEIRAEDRF